MHKEAEIFPKTRRCEYPADAITYEQKCLFHEKLLLKYLKKAVNGWSVQNFLSAEKIDQYVLYAITDFTEIVCEDLGHKGSGSSGKICDKRASCYPEKYKGWEVITIEEMMGLYGKGQINKVVIMSVLHENEIISDLLYRGIALNDLISIVSILYA